MIEQDNWKCRNTQCEMSYCYSIYLERLRRTAKCIRKSYLQAEVEIQVISSKKCEYFALGRHFSWILCYECSLQGSQHHAAFIFRRESFSDVLLILCPVTLHCKPEYHTLHHTDFQTTIGHKDAFIMNLIQMLRSKS